MTLQIYESQAFGNFRAIDRALRFVGKTSQWRRRGFFFDSTASCDAIRIKMTNITGLPSNQGLFAWLVADNDAQYTKLGQMNVQTNGSVRFIYRENSGKNLLATNKKLLISRESIPFSGLAPTLSSIPWADSLFGPGLPSVSSPLARVRNCLVTFSNTYQALGLALVFKIDSTGYLDHAGFARDAALGNNTGNARTHSDHVFDFIMGHLTGLVAGNSSVVSHTDPVGYGFRRYWELGTHDSTQGGAGNFGGAGYQIGLALNDPSATPIMIREGSSALTAIRNAFGSQNDSGLARKVTDRSLNIINGNYVTGGLVTEGAPLYQLADQLLHGTVSPVDTASSTGGIVQAYYHLQRMAGFTLNPLLASSVPADKSPVVPTGYKLYQNFPNPFNPSTEVVFELPAKSRVWLSVYNVLGQQVAVLIDGEDFVQGRHRSVWNGDEPTGVYFCRLEARDFGLGTKFSTTRRMLLLR